MLQIILNKSLVIHLTPDNIEIYGTSKTFNYNFFLIHNPLITRNTNNSTVEKITMAYKHLHRLFMFNFPTLRGGVVIRKKNHFLVVILSYIHPNSCQRMNQSSSHLNCCNGVPSIKQRLLLNEKRCESRHESKGF